MATIGKDPQAFRTIGELAEELGVAQHILRYWETKFPLRPMQRAGNRRYYRPADCALARRIHGLLSEQGYTIRGVQKLLKNGDPSDEEPVALATTASDPASPADRAAPLGDDLRALRETLVSALKD